MVRAERRGGADAATAQAGGAREGRRDCTEARGGDLGGSPWFLRGWVEVPLIEEEGRGLCVGSGSDWVCTYGV